MKPLLLAELRYFVPDGALDVLYASGLSPPAPGPSIVGCLSFDFFNTVVLVMAGHALAIAKASFAAGMMRPDPAPVLRTDVSKFHSALDDLVSQCTPANVQV